MTMRLAAEIWRTPQCRYTPGVFIGIARPVGSAGLSWRLLYSVLLSAATDRLRFFPAPNGQVGPKDPIHRSGHAAICTN
jgi:hypothetical protein